MFAWRWNSICVQNFARIVRRMFRGANIRALQFRGMAKKEFSIRRVTCWIYFLFNIKLSKLIVETKVINNGQKLYYKQKSMNLKPTMYYLQQLLSFRFFGGLFGKQKFARHMKKTKVIDNFMKIDCTNFNIFVLNIQALFKISKF